jgi:6-phosphofructokinase 1
MEEFLDDVKACQKEYKGVLVVVSEGLCDRNGVPISDTGIVDGFGHKVPGGVAQTLSEKILHELGLKSRCEKPGLLGRASIALQSQVDRDEAEEIGAYAVRIATEGATGVMASINRLDGKYRCEYTAVPLRLVANAEKKFPVEWINKRGNGIRDGFKQYCLPLIGGGLFEYADFENTLGKVGI